MQKKSLKLGLSIVFLMLMQPTYARTMIGTGCGVLIDPQTNKLVKYLDIGEKVNTINEKEKNPIINYNGKDYKINMSGLISEEDYKEYLEKYAPKYRYLDDEPMKELEPIDKYLEIRQFVANFQPKGKIQEEQLREVISYMGTYNLGFGVRTNQTQLETIETEHISACGGITSILVRLLDKTDLKYRVVVERSGNYEKETESHLVGHIYPEVRVNSKWLSVDSSIFTSHPDLEKERIEYKNSERKYSAITKQIIENERIYNNHINLVNTLKTDSENKDLRLRVGNTYLKGKKVEDSGFVLYINNKTLLTFVKEITDNKQ